MKLVAVLGSPVVHGNSNTVAHRFIDTAKQLGAQTEVFSLNKLSFKGCQACMRCKKDLETCVLKDDMAKVLEAVREADVVLLATPIYYAEISSQLKAFIDRTFCYMKPDYMSNPNPCRLTPGKTLVFVQSQGQPQETMYADVFKRYEMYFRWYGFKETHLIRALGVYFPDDVQKRTDILTLAEDLAKKIIK